MKQGDYIEVSDFVYVAKAVDMVKLTFDFAKEDLESYFNCDLADPTCIDTAINKLENAKKIVNWIADNRYDNLIVCDFTKDWFSDVEITTELPKNKEEE